MQNLCVIILTLSLFFCSSCEEDDGCLNEEVLCQEALELVDNGTFVGDLSYCNAQPGQLTTQAIARVNLWDTGAIITLKSDPPGFIDTFFHVTYSCGANGECLFGDVDFLKNNQEAIIDFQGGNISFLKVRKTPYLDCYFLFTGRLEK